MCAKQFLYFESTLNRYKCLALKLDLSCCLEKCRIAQELFLAFMKYRLDFSVKICVNVFKKKRRKKSSTSSGLCSHKGSYRFTSISFFLSVARQTLAFTIISFHNDCVLVSRILSDFNCKWHFLKWFFLCVSSLYLQYTQYHCCTVIWISHFRKITFFLLKSFTSCITEMTAFDVLDARTLNHTQTHAMNSKPNIIFTIAYIPLFFVLSRQNDNMDYFNSSNYF